MSSEGMTTSSVSSDASSSTRTAVTECNACLGASLEIRTRRCDDCPSTSDRSICAVDLCFLARNMSEVNQVRIFPPQLRLPIFHLMSSMMFRSALIVEWIRTSHSSDVSSVGYSFRTSSSAAISARRLFESRIVTHFTHDLR